MKKLFFLLLILGTAAALGYLLGTEKGRAQRDVLLVKLGRGSESGGFEETAEVDLAAAVDA